MASRASKATGVSPGAALDFLTYVGRLKVEKRTGWIRSGVRNAESVSDHLMRVASFGFLLDRVAGSPAGGQSLPPHDPHEADQGPSSGDDESDDEPVG